MPKYEDLKVAPADMLQRCLALNAAFETETSPLNETRLKKMLGQACLALSRSDGAAFMICFDEKSGYESPNFLWMRSRFDSFVYIDRIIVSPEVRGQKVGRNLYECAFAHAERSGRSRVTCEVNVEPPNPASEAFHAALGFREIEQASNTPGKIVRYMEKTLAR